MKSMGNSIKYHKSESSRKSKVTIVRTSFQKLAVISLEIGISPNFIFRSSPGVLTPISIQFDLFGDLWFITL